MSCETFQRDLNKIKSGEDNHGVSPITPIECDRGRQKEADAKGEANVVRPFALRRAENLDRVRRRSHVANVVEKAR